MSGGGLEVAGVKSDECEVRVVLVELLETVEKVRVCRVWAVEAADSEVVVYRLSEPSWKGAVVEMPYLYALASSSRSS